MEYFIYIVYSKTKNSYYVGYTSNLQERLLRHNQKSKGFTGSRNDWQIVHSERFSTKTEAMKRELQIKSWKSRIKIEALLDTDTPT
jgi:putative endonuclease